jgi:hypothetical protein
MGFPLYDRSCRAGYFIHSENAIFSEMARIDQEAKSDERANSNQG